MGNNSSRHGWLAFLVALSGGVAVIGALRFARLLGVFQGNGAGLVLVILFGLLLLWIAFSFWSATLGFLHSLLGPRRPLPRPVEAETERTGLREMPKTAVLMPIFNESPPHWSAGLKATHQTLRETGMANGFDFFILSDTGDPDIWLQEELAWAELDEGGGGARFFYRRRPEPKARKSGNLADFCQRWGSQYKYMLILDADSVMDGATIVEMIRRMEQDDELGILQAPNVPVNRHSLFARVQQFAASVYGPVFGSGFALWSKSEANYFGHNAAIRVAPFMKCCGLPVLPGREPLGGEILSHDFVEAALMRRAGWKVVLASDLAGSYEECPTTLEDFAKRDRRWCQGNMQHLRLIVAYGFHPVSRVHLGIGAMSYISSPLWLLFMVLGVVGIGGLGVALEANGRPATPPEAHAGTGLGPLEPLVPNLGFGGLLAMTLLLLFLPKLWGYLLILLRERNRLPAYGGSARLGASVFLEKVISVLTAPIMMLFHSTFVVYTLLGRPIQWVSTRRGEGKVELRDALNTHSVHTIAGLVGVLAVRWQAPPLFWWLLPVLAGLTLSIPIAMLLGSSKIGRALRKAGLLLIAEETDVPPVLQMNARTYSEAVRRGKAARLDPFRRVMLDPAFNRLHRGVLQASGIKPPPKRLGAISRVALYGGPEHLTRRDKLDLLSRDDAVLNLHKKAWTRWPMSLLDAANPGH